MPLAITYTLEADPNRDGTYTSIIADSKTGVGTKIVLSYPENATAEMQLPLENRDGDWSPRNSSAAHWPYAGEEGIPVRLKLTHNAITYTLFAGYIQEWEWDPRGFKQEIVHLRCGDILSMKGQDLVTVDPGAYDTDGAFAALFAAMGMTSGEYDTSVDCPQTLTNFFATKERGLEVVARLLAASMGGTVYTAPSTGKPTYRPRNHFLGIASPTTWGDGTNIKPRLAPRERRTRGSLLTKVETRMRKTTTSDADGGAGEVVVYDHGLGFTDQGGVVLTLSPNQVVGPFRLVPNQSGVSAIFGTAKCVEFIDYAGTTTGTSAGTLAPAGALNVVLTPVPGLTYHYDMTIRNTSATTTYYMHKLQVRSVAIVVPGGNVVAVKEGLSPTGTDDASLGTAAWTSPASISASDDADASVALAIGATSHYLKAVNFGVTLPSNAIVHGILIEAEAARSSEGGTVTPISCRIVKGGTVQTAVTKTATPGLGDAYLQFGGGSDFWDLELTPADVNAADFGCVLYVDNAAVARTYTVDHVRIIVFYMLETGTRETVKSFVSELAIPDLKAAGSRTLDVPYLDDENLVRDFGHSELMKGRYPREEIELLFDWKHDDIIVQMLGLEYGQLKYYKDTSLGARGGYCDEHYRVVGFTHTLTVGRNGVYETVVRLRPAHLFHNLDKLAWDDFNRADGALGTTPTGDTWTVVSGTWAIAGNKAMPTTVSPTFNNITFDVGVTDMKLLLQVPTIGSSGTTTARLQYRFFDNNNRWYVDLQNASGTITANLYKVSSGVPTNQTPVVILAAPIEVRVVVLGDRHIVWINRKRVYDITDSANNTRTKIGIESTYTTSAPTIDNLSVIGLSA